MLNRTATLAAAIAIAMLSLPAAAGADGFTYIGGEGGWEPSQHKYVQGAAGLAHSDECDHAIRPANSAGLSTGDGFDFVGGEAGWQPVSHKYEWAAGGLAHTDECDHAIRVVMAPTPAEIEAARALYPG